MNKEHLEKVVCVTGAAKRIGADIVRYMHAVGYNVIIHYHTSHNEAETLQNELNNIRAHSAKIVQADLCDSSQYAMLTNAIIECFGRLDVLVHNASRFYPNPEQFAIDSYEQAWQELFASNTHAPFYLTQFLTPELKKTHGCVVSILDIHANDKPFKGYSIYNMAKASHRMMVKSLALELAPNIRINGVAPGVNLWPDDASDQAIKAYSQNEVLSSVPLSRSGTPKDIAHAVHYLATASYVTGEVICVDGGRSLTMSNG